MHHLVVHGVAAELRASGRTIEGLVLPYGVPAIGPGGVPELPSPGGLRNPVVALVDDHSPDPYMIGPTVGVAELREGPGGVWMRATVDDTPEGRSFYARTLERIQSGAAALSLGFNAIADPIRNGFRMLDEYSADHVAVLAPGRLPAYPGAQVTELRALAPEHGAPPMTHSISPFHPLAPGAPVAAVPAAPVAPVATAPVAPVAAVPAAPVAPVATAPVAPVAPVVTAPVAPVAPVATAPVVEPAATDVEMRAQVAELVRLSQAQQGAAAALLQVNQPHPFERMPEIRTAGEWLVNAHRGLFPDLYTAEEHRLALDRMRMSDVELRAVAVSDSGDAVMPPQFLGPIEELVRSGRPFANALGSLPLPSVGNEIDRSSVSQGTTVAWEAAEGDEGGSTEFQTSDVSGKIKAVKGVNALTMQAVQRGNPSTVDSLLMDQNAALATEIENAVINGTGTLTSPLGTLAGLLANASIQDTTIATWSLASFVAAWRAALIQVVNATNSMPRFTAMTPRRWIEILTLLDGQDRPSFAIDDRPTTNTFGGGGLQDGTPSSGISAMGSISGVPVVASGSVPENLGAGTDEDVISLVGQRAFELYEGPQQRAQFLAPDTFLTSFGHAKLAVLQPIKPAGFVTITGLGLR